MPATYEPIATQTLGTAAASITFSSIPATYTDLRLVIVPIGATGDCQVKLNNDASALYSSTYLAGNGTTASSGRYSAANAWTLSQYSTMSATVPDLRTLDIFSYAGSTFKTGLDTESVDRNGTGSTARAVLLYRSTTVISRLDIFTVGTAFQSGTTATLYGIKAA